MSTTNLGYCPKCRQNVSLMKKELDVCLLIILFAFTGGIGGIIYLIIWALQPTDHCVLCGSRTMPLTTAPPVSSSPSSNPDLIRESPINVQSPVKNQSYAAPTQSPQNNYDANTQFQTGVQYQDKKDAEKKYCPYCGNELQTKAKFCAVCGSSIQ